MGSRIFRTLGIALVLWGVLAPGRGSAADPMRTALPIVTLQMKAEQMLDSIHRMPPPEGAQKQDISGFVKQQLPPRMGLLNVKSAFEDIPTARISRPADGVLVVRDERRRWLWSRTHVVVMTYRFTYMPEQAKVHAVRYTE
ncbi:hypothetical protein [Stenotrophomonas sp. CC120223-11]|uniref:hypothetical protein n=1 Tax=Stenotrophomonas sp. CC120223-11 TaxID=1378090 RepID=UPI000BCE4DC6|nr:hypothetical protein [Stenotrophomonas sp. CC120223-11]SNY66282.1 hypothetical protein SAMN02744784_01785 [Stenotrophomonas sp. CC120223-11]